MEQMTITAKVQIVATDADKVLFDETMSVYRDACNYVSDYVFQTHDLKQFSLNKVLYSTLREKFGLKSQMAQSVLKTVIARYRTILENQNKWIRPTFKKPQYDLVWNRDYSLTQNCFSVNTLIISDSPSWFKSDSQVFSCVTGSVDFSSCSEPLVFAHAERAQITNKIVTKYPLFFIITFPILFYLIAVFFHLYYSKNSKIFIISAQYIIFNTILLCMFCS